MTCLATVRLGRDEVKSDMCLPFSNSEDSLPHISECLSLPFDCHTAYVFLLYWNSDHQIECLHSIRDQRLYACHWAIFCMLFCTLYWLHGMEILHSNAYMHKHYLQIIPALNEGSGCYQIVYRVLYPCKYYSIKLFSVLNYCQHCIIIYLLVCYFSANCVYQKYWWMLSVEDGVGV